MRIDSTVSPWRRIVGHVDVSNSDMKLCCLVPRLRSVLCSFSVPDNAKHACENCVWVPLRRRFRNLRRLRLGALGRGLEVLTWFVGSCLSQTWGERSLE